MDGNKNTARSTEESSEESSPSRRALEATPRRGMIRSHSTSFERKSCLKDLNQPRSLRIERTIDMTGSLREISNKSVRFSSVDVRDYALCLGDNPSVSRGAPISLGWDYDQEHSYEINTYEHDRFGDRRDSVSLKLPSLQRIQLLKTIGYSRGEINEQVKEVNRVKHKRFETRRKVEREDNLKAFRNLIRKPFECILPKSSTKMKSEDWSCRATADKCLLSHLTQAEEDTLTSSTSTKNSELSVAEYYEKSQAQ